MTARARATLLLMFVLGAGWLLQPIHAQLAPARTDNSLRYALPSPGHPYTAPPVNGAAQNPPPPQAAPNDVRGHSPASGVLPQYTPERGQGTANLPHYSAEAPARASFVPLKTPTFMSGPYQPPTGAATPPWQTNMAQQQPHNPPVRSDGPQGELFEPGEILARIGDQHILAGDVLPIVNQTLEAYRDRVPENELDAQRRVLMQQLVEQMLDVKLLYLDFLRSAQPERLPEIRRKVYEQFDENELDKALQRAGVSNPAELDAKLREFGSSLEKQKRAYMERTLGRAMIGQKVKLNPEVTHDEMLQYYHQHINDYFVPAKARWEMISVHFNKFPSKSEAWQAIAWYGDQHLLGGVPFATVAKRYSHGFNAAQGGYHDWTTQGALASRVLDEAIFTLDVGKLSPILEDETGFHIVQVLERVDAGRTPFTEAQTAIKEAMHNEKTSAALKKYLAELRANTYVWTAFDEPAQ